MTGPLVAGIGFRRGTDADEIAALIARALGELGAAYGDLIAVATAADRAAEPALAEAAARFDLAPCPVAPEALTARDAELVTRSARIEHLRGIGSLAEAAALAAAGPGSRLALPRIASGGATCALAVRQTTAPAA
ncbi:cobalt-precorrin 5A hydrolase [Methylobacterium phyllostachyos]|uniref:Cobalt-precorrin 5A hydrolase n=1 Tax=Methylobacterium phyllostachyos TaxID=582672 RepID=A0A1G9WPQ5_9HYPH|nr:cobalamin biosynthesis protein [Methylobacterium phyllostachyos]SDM86450.1 cobalt-precorrin 5A hydrolase [Methylobacterium phyllostachyos]